MKPDPPTPTPPSWGQADWPSLLDAARRGEDDATREVFQRLSSYTVMLAGSRLGADLLPKVGASDIAQRSLLEAFGRFDAFDGQSEAEIHAWIGTIVQNNIIDAARFYRGAQRRSQSREMRLDTECHATNIPSTGQPPSFALRRAEEDAELERALGRLDARQRQVIELRYRRGLDYRQVAAAMGLSEPAARKLCSRTLKTLQTLLAGDHDTTRST